MKAYILKIFVCLLLLPMFIFIPQTVNAEKTDWYDRSFYFKNLRRIVLLDLDATADLGYVGNAAAYKVQSDYYDKAIKKSKCTIITEDQAKSMLGVRSREALIQNISAVADGWVQCTVKTWDSSYYIIPARTVWESKRMTRSVRTGDGSYWEEEYYVNVPVTYPPRRVDVSNLAVSFELFSTYGNAVFVRDDVRSREDPDAQKDMFGRMCNSFFEDLGKKIR